MRTLHQCPACGSATVTIAAALDDERRARFLAFSRIKYGGMLDETVDTVPPVVSRCGECHHHWYRHQPEPELLGRMYAAGRPLFAGAVPSRTPSTRMQNEMTRLHNLASNNGSATLLDYGSGYGRWARAAVEAGFTVTAFEPSMERGAEKTIPFELVHSVDSLRGRHFTAVQLEQVLEHVPDPLVTLRDLRGFCTADTVLRITVPNILRPPEGRAVWALWPFDGRTAHIMAPYEHLHGFTPQSLDRLIERAGFRPLSTARLMRHYPSIPVRTLAGRFVPALGITMRLVHPSPTALTAGVPT